MDPFTLLEELNKCCMDVAGARLDLRSKTSFDSYAAGMAVMVFFFHEPTGMPPKVILAMQIAGTVGVIGLSHLYDAKRVSQDDNLRQCEINYAELRGKISQSMVKHPFDTLNLMEAFGAEKQEIDNCRREWYHPSKYHPVDWGRTAYDVFRS
jgi:hypothetical protein